VTQMACVTQRIKPKPDFSKIRKIGFKIY